MKMSLRGEFQKRGTQSKVSPSFAPLWLLSRRGESNPGAGGGTPGDIDKNNVLALPPAKGQIPKPRERDGGGRPRPLCPSIITVMLQTLHIH